ncbi:hypothetical protein A2303_06370 [Candidatus Falkowbacteria bacterium RIFOXYB2_FULL_47_14]|uniref:DUF5666 domain-containing protein n=1 Tax=Candidatus Falkowbacteria bacterium RIFOXYA2_FULL_47_19 TaxID=1797994 RepID=A0A1F5SJ49_9BACT|nr:MAG: hypothetical protein A2227_06450 [Candidatus Falkowbacteria bacterium RIFOXYA2_FULL_47_19]OGF35729.1 MAG: hypothetical protein A2468_05125 [Candidatus Falkowbacteria bacterium RIFOXYC2_FULL_46_15]OGF43966.1 MAG: hypothetical protein A2303_06370 [Candidatus Falkowbacteria bacterium RIFOXYB2_FULL_47_14]
MNKKAIIIASILIVAAIASGYFLARSRSGGGFWGPGTEPKDLTGLERSVFEGELAGISGVAINLKILKETGDMPLPDKEREFELLKIAVGKDAEIVKQTDAVKPKEQFIAEQDKFKVEFAAMTKEGKSTAWLEAPDWQVSEKIALNSLKNGDKLRVYAYRDKDNTYYARKMIVMRAENTVEESGGGQAPGARVELSGVIEEVLSGLIRIKETGPTGPTGESLKIVITGETRIIKKTVKTAAQFKKEQAEFSAKIAAGEARGEEVLDLEAPNWYVTAEAGVNNLSVGQEVNIYGVNDSNKNDQILAEKIEYTVK